MKILLITSSLPYPPTTGATIRIWHLMQQVARHHDVTLLSLVGSDRELRFLPHLQPYCSAVDTVVKQRRRPRGKLFLQIFKAMLKGQPPQNGIAYYPEMGRHVRELTSRQRFDIVQIELAHMAPYVEFVAGSSDFRRLITLHNVSATQYERISKVQLDSRARVSTWLDWLFLRRWEPTYMARHFDKCIVMSSVDQSLLHRANPALNLAVVPNGVDLARYSVLPEAPGSKEILFIGKMDYAPNADAALYFYREVFPLVRQAVPEARLLIVGTQPEPLIKALAVDPAVEVTGYVEDVVPYYERASLCVVPLRAGSGTRLKILEAMALGRPVLSTALGCEGLDVTPGDDILVADAPAELAWQTVHLLTNPDLCGRLAKNGRRLVESSYDWNVVGNSLLRVYEELANDKATPAYQMASGVSLNP